VQDSSGWARDLRVEVAGRGVVAHTGSVAVRLLADRSGLTGRLSQVLNPKDALILHDRGRVLTDVAVVIADGGRVVSDLAVLRDQDELFGPVASDPTLWRTLNSVDEHTLARIAAARAKTRVLVWNLMKKRHGAIPAARLAGGEDLGRTVVIRLDATITIAHSDKEQAAGTFKGTFGHHALTAWCDNTDENLAVRFRPGNAGSNTTADHLEVLTEAIRQVPAPYRRDLLITCDGAGSTLDLLHHITELNKPAGRKVHYSVGFDLDTRARTAIGKVPAGAWQHVLDTRGQARDLDKAGVVELTGLLRESAGGDRLKTWPEGNAGHRPPRKAPPGSPTVLVRGTGRLALPAVRYQHAHHDPGTARADRGPGSPSPCSRTRGGPDPDREEHRPGPLPLQERPDQPGLDRRRGDRLRPAGCGCGCGCSA
jgi:hypothetical protein